MVNTNKLYIGNLSHEVTEENLREFFEERGLSCGQMVRLLVKKGFAFLECLDQAAADLAIDRCHGQPLLGTIVTVEPSLASKANRMENKSTVARVLVSNCGDAVSTQELESYLTSYGGSILATERSRRGSFIVTFPSARQADQVVLQCNGSNIQGNIITVEKCSPISYGAGDDRSINRFRSLSEARLMIPGGPRGEPDSRDIFQHARTYYQSRAEDIPLKILVPSEWIGALIGRGGQTIKGISMETGARLDVFRNVSRWEMTEKPVTIYGPPEKASQACKKVLELMAKETNHATLPKSVDVCLRMLAYNSLVGRVIGKGGSIIKKIMEDTQTKIHISNQPEYIGTTSLDSPQERVITVRGSIDGMSSAESIISEKLRVAYSNDYNSTINEDYMQQPMMGVDGYISPARASLNYATANDSQTSFYSCNSNRSFGHNIQSPSSGRMQSFTGMNLSYHHPETTYMYIPNDSIGAVIGRKGANIRRIIHESGASVKILDYTVEMSDIPMRRISIHGGIDAIFRAQYYVVEKVLDEGRDNILPESCMTVEMGVPGEHVGRLIGKAGQHIREIQRVCHCRVKFITEEDTNIPPPPHGEVFVRITGTVIAMNEAQQKLRSLLIYAISRATNNRNINQSASETSINNGQDEMEIEQ